MKTKINIQLAVWGVALMLSLLPARGQIVIPGANGSDGVLNATGSNYVINLANAMTRLWTDSPDIAGNGVYDADKWAVVFKYSSVNIPAGTTVSFINHPTHAPVVWLVNGKVTINGTLNLNGQSGNTDPVNLPEGGPGGFRGGARNQQNLSEGPGFGPGGGTAGVSGSGVYGPGTTLSYGNAQIVPLIGGSGGSGYSNGYNGAGGGGAILIAAAETISINSAGQILANSPSVYGLAYFGSGGAIRLVANQIAGAGRLEAGSPFGGAGRIRIEANSVSQALSIDPPTIGVFPNPVVIWPPTNAPTVQVVSVSGVIAPSDPRANLNSNAGDLTLTNTGLATIVLQTKSFPTNGMVNVFVKPRNDNQNIYSAQFMSGTTNTATWQVRTNLPLGHFVIQARAVTP